MMRAMLSAAATGRGAVVRRKGALGAAFLFVVLVRSAPGQQPRSLPRAQEQAVRTSDRPLERTFSANGFQQYRIQLRVRIEVRGDHPEKIGANAYVKSFSSGAEEVLRWSASRRVMRLTADRGAELEEVLDHFELHEGEAFAGESSTDAASALSSALKDGLARWIAPGKRTLHYRETRTGEVQGVGAEGVPVVGEASPPVLTLWLLRSLRPAGALPAQPVIFGARWESPRMVNLQDWSGIRADESGEWMDAPDSAGQFDSAVRLLTVQQIAGAVHAGKELPSEGTADASFHGESLATIALSDGRLLAAARSAAREIRWRLLPVDGLDHPPEFHSRLLAEIDIKECHGSCSED
jgi:hypothetical protein